MKYNFNGQIFEYGYKDMLKDIQFDLDNGLIAEDSIIYIERAKTPAFDDYYPIIHYLYKKDIEVSFSTFADTCPEDAKDMSEEEIAVMELFHGELAGKVKERIREGVLQAASLLAVKTEMETWKDRL